MSETKAELVYEYAACPNGHEDVVGDLEVQQIEADPKGGWTATGVGRKGYCPTCGKICELITMRLPVELENLPCPRCHASGNYRFALTCVRTERRNFEFTASVTCAKCSTRSVFNKLASSLRRIRGIKVGPFGLDLDPAK
jgi:hypothetical protein